MSDSGSGGSQFVAEVKGAVGEVAKEVKDAVGEVIEQGVQSVVGSQLTPQQIQQKQLQDQKDLTEARRKIEWLKKLDHQQKTVRQQEKQKQAQNQQDEMQEQQEKKIEQIQVQQTPKRPGQLLREDMARAQVERSKGRGVGG